MEHRWGTRKPVSLPVTLTTAGGVAAVGVLRDVSVSGAFIATPATINLHEQIQLSVYTNASRRSLLGSFNAHIVRRDGGAGIGIEWDELAPESLAQIEEHGSGARHRARSTPPRQRHQQDGFDAEALDGMHAGHDDGDGSRPPGHGTMPQPIPTQSKLARTGQAQSRQSEPTLVRRRGSRLR